MGQIPKAGRAMPAAAVAAALVTLGFPASAQQQGWRPASSNGEQRAYIDTASIRRDGDLVRFTREIRMGRIHQFGSGARYDILGALMEVDCRARTLRSLEGYLKLGDAVVLREEGDGGMEPVRPGTTADTDLRAVCFDDWPR